MDTEELARLREDIAAIAIEIGQIQEHVIAIAAAVDEAREQMDAASDALRFAVERGIAARERMQELRHAYSEARGAWEDLAADHVALQTRHAMLAVARVEMTRSHRQTFQSLPPPPTRRAG